MQLKRGMIPPGACNVHTTSFNIYKEDDVVGWWIWGPRRKLFFFNILKRTYKPSPPKSGGEKT
jgi:hypothetical protein